MTEKRGEVIFQGFIANRLVDKSKSFNDPIKKVHLKTFIDSEISKSSSIVKQKTQQTIQQRNIFGQLLCLTTKQDIDLKKIFCYQLTNVPYSLSTFDGFPIKTAESTLLHLLESEITHEDSIRVGSRFILDGNALLQSLVKLPPTFQKTR